MRKPSAAILALLAYAAASVSFCAAQAAGADPSTTETAGPAVAPPSPISGKSVQPDATPRSATASDPASLPPAEAGDEAADGEAARRWRGLVPGSIQ
jgi:hypothetical protein